jgi:exodeoxyribonuclease V alpha subunit
MSAFAAPAGEQAPPSGPLDVGDDEGAGGGAAQRAYVTVRGLVEKTQVYNGTWGVATIWTDEKKSVKLTGDVVGELKDGLTYDFQGEWQNSAQHGERLAAVSARPHVECDRKAIRRFIARSFKGVAERLADKFLEQQIQAGAERGKNEDEVLEEVRRTLVTAPWTLDLSSVTRKGQYDGEQNELMSEAVKRDFATRLGKYDGMKETVLKGLASWALTEEFRHRSGSARAGQISHDLVDQCWARLATNPYAPIGEVGGYGFKTADTIGLSLNIPRDDPKRLCALSAHAISSRCESGGHLFLGAEQTAAAIAQIDPSVDCAQALQAGLDSERILRIEVADGSGGTTEIYYEAELGDVEESLARRLADMLRFRCKPLSKESPEQLRASLQATARQVNPNLSGGLDASQLDALVGVLTSRSRVHTITAGPGCGKTSIMEVLTAKLGAEQFDFCAPTGRASLVLSQRLSGVGASASTIHSLFRGAGRGQFQVNEDCPLESKILVVDEGSMPAAALVDAILAGMNEDQHLIVLGDVGQLPSIEPGRVLDDILRVPQVDKHRLTSSHRSAGGLLEILAQIDAGTIDCRDREDVKFSHGLPRAENGFEVIAQEYVDAVGQHGFAQVALLMSRRKGDVNRADWNVTYANARLREICNPNAPKIPGTRFHINDRIILKENLRVPRGTSDPEAEESDEAGLRPDNKVQVVNGDTGTVKEFVRGKGNLAGAKWLRITLDDGRDVFYPAANAIDHSYAITVHSAQGGEYRRVIAIVTPGHESFVNRVMLRTQLSRARQLMTVHADDAVLRKVAATPMPPRNSRLVVRVQHYIDHPPDDDAEGCAEQEHERCAG